MDHRDFALAIAEFERAYELGNHSPVLYNLGLAYAAVGRYRDARNLDDLPARGWLDVERERRLDVLALIDGYGKNRSTSRLRIITDADR